MPPTDDLHQTDPAAQGGAVARGARAVLSGTVTFLVIAAAGGVGVAGWQALATSAAALPAPDAAPPTPVATARIAMRDAYETERRFTGQFEPRQQTSLSFEQGGTVAEVMVREGDTVARGSIIARLDIRLLEAERARLLAVREGIAAQVELARRTNERQAELRERGFATDQTLDDTSLTLTRLNASEAEVAAALASVEVQLEKALIRAPFAGRIGARLLDAGAVAGPGAPVATLLEGGPVLFRAGLDPALADRLELGHAVRIETATGPVAARLERLAPELDAATRSRTAFFAVTDPQAPPARSAGTLVLTDAVAATGAWLPVAALRQGPRGTWQVLTVEDDVVGIEAAEVIHIDGSRAYVRGTFADGMAYLSDGTHRVVPGERVLPQDARPDGPALARAQP